METKEKMDIRIGPPVSGSNYFVRPALETRLRAAIWRGHVSILAPRRTGKTSLLKRLRDAAPDEDPHIFINLEKCTTPAEWMDALLAAIPGSTSRFGGWFKTISDRLTKVEGIEITTVGKVAFKGKDWVKAAEAIAVALETLDRPTVFLLDEFPILVNEMARKDLDECRKALRWFRDWRDRTAEGSVRFVVTGSIGLDGVVERHQLGDTVNNFEAVDFPPLDADETAALLDRLAEDNAVSIDDALRDRVLQALGVCYPISIQTIVKEMGEARTPITAKSFDAFYQRRIVAGPNNEYCKNMERRLGEAFGLEDEKLASRLLEAVLQSSEGLNGSQLIAAIDPTWGYEGKRIRGVVRVLEHDGYLVQEPEAPFRYSFLSRLLEDYWRRRI